MVTTKNKKALPHYLSGLCIGKYTLREAAESTGYTPEYLCTLKKKFKAGWDCKTYNYRRTAPANKIPKKQRDMIVNLYVTEYKDYNFSFFLDCLKEFENINISYHAIRNIMAEYGIKSPNCRRVKKTKPAIHRPRLRREAEGDMIQIDGTPYQWFKWCGDNNYYSIMGGIDDATGKLFGLYMCENECLHGYNELMRYGMKRYGKPRCIYSDKAAIFCRSPKDKFKLTIAEQLAGLHESRTQWQRELNQLGIVQILAHSPQAKGRVERMWSTIQGRLPGLFRRYGIRTIADANKFMADYFVDYFNSRFSVKAVRDDTFYLPVDDNLDDILCARFPKRTHKNGSFKFQSYNFVIKGIDRVSYIDFELVISERGIYADVGGQHCEIECTDWLTDARDEIMPLCTRNILYEYLYRDMKETAA